MARPIRTHERNFYEPTLRWKRGKAYIRFYDPNRSQKQKELALHVSEEDAAHALLTELTKAYFHGFLDPWNDLHIPIQTGHVIRRKVDSQSDRNWTVNPAQTGHFWNNHRIRW